MSAPNPVLATGFMPVTPGHCPVCRSVLSEGDGSYSMLRRRLSTRMVLVGWCPSCKANVWRERVAS